MKFERKQIWLGVAALAVAGVGTFWVLRDKAPDVQYKTAKLERGPLQASVSASGTVNPVTQVSVGTQVSGQIKELYADFNSEVKAGQLIAQIDPETFEYRLRQAQADVDAAQASVLTQRASLAKAEVDAAEAQRDHERKKMLVEKNFITASEADKALSTARSQAESVNLVKAQLASAQATLAQRRAAFESARVDLARTRITSPVNGIVIKRAVEKGQTVAASLQSPELFVIAQNLQDMQVEASIDEADIGRVKSEQKASFTVDAFPGRTFEGMVGQVRKAAQNVANVVTYVAVVKFSNPGGALMPGMTANVRIITDQRDNVLKVPNAALRVKIAGLEPAHSSASASAPAASAAAPQGGGQQGAASAFRQRLLETVKPDAQQLEKIDAISAALRPQFATLRDLPEGERAKARDRIMADMRARINEVLNPEQQKLYAAMQMEMASRSSTRGRIYLMGEGEKITPVAVRLGVTDGTMTEVVGTNDSTASLGTATSVITGTLQPGSGAAKPATSSGPRMPF
jgi:HlyD family secretion protein